MLTYFNKNFANELKKVISLNINKKFSCFPISEGLIPDHIPDEM